MFSINLTSRTPIYEQIYEKVIDLIVNGTLSEGDQLPSVRTFAKETGVNPNTVAKAYNELERSGIIYSVPGRGSFIAKQNQSAFQQTALAEFDKATENAMGRGIPPDELKKHIDGIYGKGNGND